MYIVDFDKGCYLGQELVIRTEHTGTVRKRALPFYVENKVIDSSFAITHPDKLAARGTRLLHYMPKYGVGIAIVRMADSAKLPLEGYLLNGQTPLKFNLLPWWHL